MKAGIPLPAPPLDPNIPAVDGAIEPVPKMILDEAVVLVDAGGALDAGALVPESGPNPEKAGLPPAPKLNWDCSRPVPLELKVLPLVVDEGLENENIELVAVDCGGPPKKAGIEEPVTVDVAVLVVGPNADDPNPNLSPPAALALRAAGIIVFD